MCPLRIFVILFSLIICIVALILSIIYDKVDNKQDSNSVIRLLLISNKQQYNTYKQQFIDIITCKYIYNIYKQYKYDMNNNDTEHIDDNNDDCTIRNNTTESIIT